MDCRIKNSSSFSVSKNFYGRVVASCAISKRYARVTLYYQRLILESDYGSFFPFFSFRETTLSTIIFVEEDASGHAANLRTGTHR